MAKKKTNKILGAFSIFFSSAKTYFLYFDQCFKYLSFPIFGQLIGLALIFTCTYYFNTNIDSIRNISPFFDKHIYTIFSIILLPFFIIFAKEHIFILKKWLYRLNALLNKNSVAVIKLLRYKKSDFLGSDQILLAF